MGKYSQMKRKLHETPFPIVWVSVQQRQGKEERSTQNVIIEQVHRVGATKPPVQHRDSVMRSQEKKFRKAASKRYKNYSNLSKNLNWFLWKTKFTQFFLTSFLGVEAKTKTEVSKTHEPKNQRYLQAVFILS